jgi:hypothetical protein
LLRPWVGASWEGLVVEQILGLLTVLGRRHEAYHLGEAPGLTCGAAPPGRTGAVTRGQREIDLLIETSGELWAFEVKLTGSPSPADMRRLDNDADLVGATRRHLVSQVPAPPTPVVLRRRGLTRRLIPGETSTRPFIRRCEYPPNKAKRATHRGVRRLAGRP